MHFVLKRLAHREGIQLHPDGQLVYTWVERMLLSFVGSRKVLCFRRLSYFMPLFFSIASWFGSAPRKFL